MLYVPARPGCVAVLEGTLAQPVSLVALPLKRGAGAAPAGGGHMRRDLTEFVV